MNILILGSGGREHALAQHFSLDFKIKKIFVFPGNDGMEMTDKVQSAGCASFKEFQDLKIMSLNPDPLISFAIYQEVSLVIVGSELPLSLGLVDYWQNNCEIPILGPNLMACQLEVSKKFCKDLLKENNIPTAYFKSYKKEELQLLLVQDPNSLLASFSHKHLPVIKASGLCSGKGVVCPDTREDFFQTLGDFCYKKEEGFDASEIIIEERLFGPEVSLFYLCDGLDFLELGAVCDYKRLYDNNQGPNTGGMGAHPASSALLSGHLKKQIKNEIIIATLKALKEREIHYRGFLFLGVMLCDSGPKVIEYNCRLGDPETQVLLPLIKTPLFSLFSKTAKGELKEWIEEHGENISYHNQTAIHVVATHPDYCQEEVKKKYALHLPFPKMTSSHKIKDPHFSFVSAGVVRSSDQKNYETKGGRVFGLTVMAPNLLQARQKVYQYLKEINFEKAHYRLDIGEERV